MNYIGIFAEDDPEFDLKKLFNETAEIIHKAVQSGGEYNVIIFFCFVFSVRVLLMPFVFFTLIMYVFFCRGSGVFFGAVILT